jgi:hypothetical protein
MAKRLPRPDLSERDISLLLFLWRHRLSTFRVLKNAFFPNGSTGTAYNRLKRLRKAEYIRTDFIDGTSHPIWCLDARGFRLLESEYLPELKTKAYMAQSKLHDLRAMAVLLGDWYLGAPEGVQIVTEQEFASTEVDEIPQALRDGAGHLPDGAWIFRTDNDPRGVALEIETAAKASARYERICSIYASRHFFEKVVWVVQSGKLAERILKCASAGAFSMNQHLFIGLRDFERRGWDATFLNASLAGLSLGSFLQSQLASSKLTPSLPPIQRGSKPSPNHPQACITSPFFDFRFFRTKTIACEESPKPQKA